MYATTFIANTQNLNNGISLTFYSICRLGLSAGG
jgi:hypothetical protein